MLKGSQFSLVLILAVFPSSFPSLFGQFFCHFNEDHGDEENGENNRADDQGHVALVLLHELVVVDDGQRECNRGTGHRSVELNDRRDELVGQRREHDREGNVDRSEAVLQPVSLLSRGRVLVEDPAFNQVDGRGQLKWVGEEQAARVDALYGVGYPGGAGQGVSDDLNLCKVAPTQVHVEIEDDVEGADTYAHIRHMLEEVLLIFDDQAEWHQNSDTLERA